LDIGTLTGRIELEDLLSSTLMKVDARLKEVEAAAGSSMSMAAGQMTLAVTAGTMLANVLTNVVSKAVSFGTDLVKNSVMAGAELARLTTVSVFLGDKMGYSANYVNALSAAIEKSGITGMEARNAIIQLEKAHVDLSKASQLSLTAQNMAVVSGRGSSETYGMMIRAITTLNPQMIRNAGFTFTMEKVLSDYERTTGKTTTTMGMHEKQGLLVNAMLKEGAEFAGLYEESLGTAAKQLGSAERAWAQVSEQLGTAFLPVTNALADAWYRLATATRNSATDAKGAVAELMNSVGKNLADIIKKTADLSGEVVKSGRAIYDAYKAIPEVYRDLGLKAAGAALGVWALHAAVTALMGLGVVKWAISAGTALAGIASGTMWSSALLGTGALTKSLRILIDEMLVTGFRFGAITTALRGFGLAFFSSGIGITSLVVGLGYALYEVGYAIKHAYDWWNTGKPMWDFFTQQDKGNWVRRLLGMDTGDDAKIASATSAIDNQRQALEALMKGGNHGADEAAMAAKRAQDALDRAAEERRIELQAEYTAVVTATTDAVRKSQYVQNANAEALEKTDKAIRMTKEAQEIFLPGIEKQIALGRALTETQRNYYTSVKDAERADLASGVEKAKVNGVTLQLIASMKAQGLQESEILLKLGLTSAALATRVTVMTEARGILEGLNQLESQLIDTLEVQAQKTRNLAYEEGVRNLSALLSVTERKAAIEALEVTRSGAAIKEMTDLKSLGELAAGREKREADLATMTLANALKRNEIAMAAGQQEIYSIQRIEELTAKQRELVDAANQVGFATGQWPLSLDEASRILDGQLTRLKSIKQEISGIVYAWQDFSRMFTATPDSLQEMFGVYDANTNPTGFDTSTPTPPQAGNPSGFASVTNPVTPRGTQSPVVIHANGAFFGANERQVVRALEDMLAKSKLTQTRV